MWLWRTLFWKLFHSCSGWMFHHRLNNASKHTWISENDQKWCQIIVRFHFLSTLENYDTHLADSFLIPKYWRRMFKIPSYNLSYLASLFSRWKLNEISWILLTIMSVVKSSGSPGCSHNLWSLCNSVNHSWTMTYNRAILIILFKFSSVWLMFSCKNNALSAHEIHFFHCSNETQSYPFSNAVKNSKH